MANETLKKINDLLKRFSNTFDIEANIVEDGDEMIASGLKIKGVKNDGSQFINEFHATFNSIVQNMSDEHEVIYDAKVGLVVAKKVIKTEYIIDDIE